MTLDPDMSEVNAPDSTSTLASSVYAAAHCAQSCIRFWNLLLQDTASVNPFGFSIDGYGPASDEEEEDDEDNALDASEHDQPNNQNADGDTHLEDDVIDPYHAMLTTPRPESYMKLRTVHWWNHHVGFVREDDPNYMDVFRLPVSFFILVCGLCREDMQQGEIPVSLRNVEGRIMSVERQVAIAVMRLATGNTLKWISEHLGCGLSTVVKIVYKFVVSIRQKASEYLKWPVTEESLARVKDGFFQKHKLPNCCGAIDATHVLMELPSGEPPDVWMNRSHTYSMVLQAVMDTDLRFLDVCVGYPGSLTDAKCLKESSLFRKCQNGQRLSGSFVQVGDCFVREYIVGGTEYPLLPWLMTPYMGSGILPPLESFFNDRLNSTKISVARAFGRLKGTWRILQGTMKQPNIEKAPKMIHACCILHNMCIDAGGVEGIHLPESDVIVQHHNEEGFYVHEDESREGLDARESLCRAFSMLE